MSGTEDSEEYGGEAQHANCLSLGFSSEQVEAVEVGDNGGVQILLNEDGQEHLDQIQEMREMDL